MKLILQLGFTFLMLGVLSTSVVACGDDNEENNESGLVDKELGFRVVAVGSYKYSYDNKGRMSRIEFGKDALEFAYSPDKIIMKGSRAENDQTADVSYTAQGYLKSMNISTGTVKLSASYSYDGSGHLTDISVSYKSPKENYRTKTTLTWRNDLLRQIVFKDEDSDGGTSTDTYQIAFEYDSEKTIENPYLQFAPSLVHFESIGDGELDEALAYAGKLGKGPRLLPSSCREEWEVQDGDQTYTGSNSTDFRYGFNIDGALSCTVVGSIRYNYQYEFVEEQSDEPQDSPKDSKEFAACTDGNHPHSVDLGLPSGTRWSCCNVGADSPEDYGDYFAWGETTGYDDGKTTFSSSTYKWCNGDYNTLTKYCNNSSCGYNGFTDTKTELDPEDDAAYGNWGPKWHMPTIAQFEELINSSYTTTKWTTQNGVYGRLITSNANGNSLFLPAAGWHFDSSLRDAGSFGDYWSRTLSTSYPGSARGLCFYSGGIGTGYTDRCSGHGVRPVRLPK